MRLLPVLNGSEFAPSQVLYFALKCDPRIEEHLFFARCRAVLFIGRSSGVTADVLAKYLTTYRSVRLHTSVAFTAAQNNYILYLFSESILYAKAPYIILKTWNSFFFKVFFNSSNVRINLVLMFECGLRITVSMIPIHILSRYRIVLRPFS